MESQIDPLSKVPNVEVRLPAQAIVAAIDRLTAATDRHANATEKLLDFFEAIEGVAEPAKADAGSLDFLAR
jgi:hypothetical protein